MAVGSGLRIERLPRRVTARRPVHGVAGRSDRNIVSRNRDGLARVASGPVWRGVHGDRLELPVVYDTIVHPTDGSACSARGLDHAVSLARQYDAELHVLHVVDEEAMSGGGKHSKLVTELTEANEGLLENIDEQDRVALQDQLSTHVRSGSVSDQVLELVEDRDADLVVMGTHGRSGVDRVLRGSTAEDLLRSAAVPVLAAEVPEESA